MGAIQQMKAQAKHQKKIAPCQMVKEVWSASANSSVSGDKQQVTLCAAVDEGLQIRNVH